MTMYFQEARTIIPSSMQRLGSLPKIALGPVAIAAIFSAVAVLSLRALDTESAAASTDAAPIVAQGGTPADLTQEVAMPKTVEMNIANNGFTLLRGARVSSIEGERMTVSVRWGSQAFSWIVKITSGTKILNAKGEKSDLHDISVGSYITLSGSMDTSSEEPALRAEYIRSSR